MNDSILHSQDIQVSPFVVVLYLAKTYCCIVSFQVSTSEPPSPPPVPVTLTVAPPPDGATLYSPPPPYEPSGDQDNATGKNKNSKKYFAKVK